ncbi:MAG: hypothetical protein ACREDA_12080, partial [Methylocella sp.]
DRTPAGHELSLDAVDLATPSSGRSQANALSKTNRSITTVVLGRVDIHFGAMTAAVRLITAAKLRAVLSYRVAIRRHCLSRGGLGFEQAELGGKARGELQDKFSMRRRQRYMAKSHGMPVLRSALGGIRVLPKSGGATAFMEAL